MQPMDSLDLLLQLVIIILVLLHKRVDISIIFLLAWLLKFCIFQNRFYMTYKKTPKSLFTLPRAVGQWGMMIPANTTLIARFMGPTWGPSGAKRTQVGPIKYAIWVVSLHRNINIWCNHADFSTTLYQSWWHHQMETFSVLLALSVENSPDTSEFLSQRPVTRSFDVSFDLRLE